MVDTVTSNVVDSLKVLADAASSQPGNEMEIFQILIQLPSITNTFLPFNFSHQSMGDDGDKNDANVKPLLRQLLNSLVKGFSDQMKRQLQQDAFEGSDKVQRFTPGQTSHICECIDSLSILGGWEFSKEKLAQTLTWRLDLLLQQNMEYIADILTNIEQVERNFEALVHDVKFLALDVNKALFFCESVCLTYEQQMDFICSSILEKLSIELLTLVDAVKEAVLKQSAPTTARASVSSGPQYNLFSVLTATIGEDTFLRLNELISLSNIVSLFMDLESELHCCNCTKSLKEKSVERSKKSSLKSASQLPDLLRSSHQSSLIRSTQASGHSDLLRSSHQSSLIRSTQAFGHWSWQEILNDLGPIIARSIVKVFDDCQTEEISKARNNYHLNDSCKLSLTTSISASLFAANSGVPSQTISCFGEVLKMMKTLLPLAVLGSQYKPIQSISSQYIDECGQALKGMKSFLMTILNDIPSKASITSLYYALATCEDVCTMLTYCGSKIQPDPRVPFQGILQVYKDMNKMLRDTIIHHQHARLSTYLLHDAESHHWSDPRELNEGESPSYSIQMWNIVLHKLWSELGTCVSEVQRHQVFLELFSSSLEVLSRRYSRCAPSYNRTKQIKIDIPSILLICSSFQFHTNFHPNAMFPADIQWSSLEVKHMNSKIDAACQNLLSVLCMLACPLDVIERSVVERDQDCSGHSMNWQYFVHPNLFSQDWDGHFSGLSDEAAVYCTMSFCKIHPSQSLVHCFYALVMRKCFLLKKLVSHKLAVPSLTDIEDNVFKIFSSCGHSFTDIFFKSAYKSMKQNAGLMFMACIHDSDKEFEWPWQHHFFSALDLAMCKSLSKVVKYTMHLTWSPLGMSTISSLPEALRGQVIDLSSRGGSDGSTNCLLVCLLLTVQGLTHCIYSLPEWLVTFFANVARVTSDNSTDPKSEPSEPILGDHVLHILVLAASRYLKSIELWVDEHVELKRETVEAMKTVANLLVALCKENKLPNGAKQLKDLIIHELNNLRETSSMCFNDRLSAKDEFEASDDLLLEECSRIVENMQTRGKNAIDSLHEIKNLFTENLHLLRKEWKLGTILNCAEESHQHRTQLETVFDPVTASCTIGDDSFDHNTLIEHQWNWKVMSERVMRHAALNTIHATLGRRWEMKSDAPLQDEEKELVNNIKLHCLGVGMQSQLPGQG